MQQTPRTWPQRGLKVVCISDTHNCHRNLTIPEGDILVHAGDWSYFGKEEHTIDFNDWLGSLPHKHKIVVNGNHESNALWKGKVKEMLSNATFLMQESTTVEGVKIFGTNFFWPVPMGGNPYYDQIPDDTEILVCHGPVKGFVDGNSGCPTLRTIVALKKPKLVISGHMHGAHGIEEGTDDCAGVTFVNAAICKGGYVSGWEPVVVYI
eukprot:TRINITY_DN10031_c0_g1_i2.p1 TRINITY_DN10031_c0_g1~~TRINITY_DN10031_c0_g1_i2.p1  ORF type:complete len:208 (-),score=23.22 TRINITY_DN10031_c0_g1_i2:129-752(-)